jgi:hypothetical protein
MRVEVTVNKRRAIRNMLARLGMHATPGQVVEALESLDIEVSENFVARVKAQMFRDEAKAVRERSKRPPKTRPAAALSNERFHDNVVKRITCADLGSPA